MSKPTPPPSKTKPYVLIVHGSWHNPNHFFPLRLALHSADYSTSCPTQPSYNALKLASPLAADAACIHTAAKALVEAGHDVLVIAHSYGGLVGAEAITTTITKVERTKKGLKGGVVHMLYLCAFIVPVGRSLGEALLGRNELPAFIPVADDGTCSMLDPAGRFYNDLPEGEAEKWIKELRPQLAEAQLAPLTNAAYRFVPSTYLYCENDRALPVFLQEKMVAESGVEFGSERCTAGHSPFLSMPGRVVEVIEGIVRGLGA